MNKIYNFLLKPRYFYSLRYSAYEVISPILGGLTVWLYQYLGDHKFITPHRDAGVYIILIYIIVGNILRGK